jgi:hypothetical protein
VTDDLTPKPEQTPNPDGTQKKNDKSAFLVIGIAFFAIAITFLAQESMRAVGFAFIAIGIAFIAMSAPFSKKDRKPDSTSGPTPEA